MPGHRRNTQGRTRRAVGPDTPRPPHQPTPFPAPAPVPRTVLGEIAGDVLGSARVLPGRLLESGFTFASPDIEGALRAALAEP
ncbi:DUF1731 domain-containing protein [Streptomyces sp. NPDC001107]